MPLSRVAGVKPELGLGVLQDGWQGRGVAPVAGGQNVATPAGSRIAKKMTGSLFEHWTRTNIFGFLHRLTENIVLRSMPNMHLFLMDVFTYITIKKQLKNPDPNKCPAGRPGSLGVAVRGVADFAMVAGRGERVCDRPRPCQPWCLEQRLPASELTPVLPSFSDRRPESTLALHRVTVSHLNQPKGPGLSLSRVA